MRTLSGRMLGIAAMSLVLAVGSAGAQGKGKDKGKNRDEVVRVDEHTGNVNRVPPGLAKKPGGLPPGQYKKRYATSDGVVVLRDVFGRLATRSIVSRRMERRSTSTIGCRMARCAAPSSVPARTSWRFPMCPRRC